MAEPVNITVAEGDGIGPEIMTETLRILEAAEAAIKPDRIMVGKKAYLEGHSSGIPSQAWDSIKRNKIILKAPITTPQGKGYKSLNVTLRKTLGLYANVRPSKAFFPFISTHHPDMDLVIIRENEEDLYAGIEHRSTVDVYQTLKIVTRQGCERIIRFAFEYAKRFNRRKVTCMSKDNIMKLTDGLFHNVFDEISKEYPGFELEHQIIDIGTAWLATRPERFDVIVTSNLYGDIISDVAAQVAGSVGLAGSANIGSDYAMFEAIHGSAPDIAGKQLANPSGLLQAAIQMLLYLGQTAVAGTIQNAWLKTLEEGIHTGDIFSETFSRRRVSTTEFAQAIIDRLGKTPDQFSIVNYQTKEAAEPWPHASFNYDPNAAQRLVGVDIFIAAQPHDLSNFIEKLKSLSGPLQLITIVNRGLKIWPAGPTEIACSDCWCCRFQLDEQYQTVTQAQLLEQLAVLERAAITFVKMENLYFYGDVRGFSLAQGQ